MRGKNFILTVLMFLFVSILSMAVENSTTLSDGLSLIDPTYQEGLKEYKPNLENIDKMFNYIEKNIKQKGRAIYYSKLDQEKKEIIVTDENNKIIYTEKIPEKLVNSIPYFEVKQTYSLKNGKTLNYSEMNTEMLEKKVIHPQTGKEDYLYDIGADFSGSPEKTPITKEQWEKMKKAERKDHAWAPSFSATAFLSDNARIYVRYDETKRMPSIFEDTIGYSIDILTPLYKRKPEHSKNIEVGYVHDLRGFFPSLRRADIRLNWYKNTTKNIFDRDINYEMKQFDKRILEGVELSARYDQGRIFGDIGISYNIKNKFCDKSSAIRDVGSTGDIHTFKAYPECVNGGNENGYLKNAILPKYSITSNLGVRFLDERLEVGTRMVYHTNVKETRNKSLRDAGWFANSNNNPRWQPVFLVDAYMNYKVNENLALSLSATNLTDRYYLDPMTRSSMPAPGRTIKFGLTATF